MLILFLFFASIVERLNELTFGRILGEGKEFAKLGWVLPFTAMAFGLAVGFLAKVTIIAWVIGAIEGATITLAAPADYFISGVLIGGGSNYLHQFLSEFIPAKS